MLRIVTRTPVFLASTLSWSPVRRLVAVLALLVIASVMIPLARPPAVAWPIPLVLIAGGVARLTPLVVLVLTAVLLSVVVAVAWLLRL